jgi:predicted dehydrogenase
MPASHVRSPAHIAVCGGGRWARVVTDVLCGLVSPHVVISVHSPGNAEAMRQWGYVNGMADRMRVSAQPVTSLNPLPGAAIVVNAARDHERSVEELIGAGIPVLVEKPMALSVAGAERLVALADRHKVTLAAAHVFRFTRYLDRFAAQVRAAGSPELIRVWWTDPHVEVRYGEVKRHDGDLPIVADLMPHVLSLVGALVGDGPDFCRRATYCRNGVEVRLEAILGGVNCDIVLARQSDARRRQLEVLVGHDEWRLEFATEPGTISNGVYQQNADPDWGHSLRPMARMLTAFLEWADGGAWDRRLDSGLGVRACRVIDQALAWSGRQL